MKEVNVGEIESSPTSLKLFTDWYLRETNQTDPSTVSTGTVSAWSSFDMLEQALYRTAMQYKDDGIITGKLKSKDVLHWLSLSTLTTPLGRVAFDVNRVNNAINGIMIQIQNRNELADIIAPKDLSTSSMIYPMPTWEERVYVWTILGRNKIDVLVGTIIVAICSVILVAIIITVLKRIQKSEYRIPLFTYHNLLFFLVFDYL